MGMTDLIAVVSSGEGTWGHVQRLVNSGTFEKVWILTDAFGKEKFSVEFPFTPLVIDASRPTNLLAEDIRQALEGKITDLEVAVNFISGSGKEHMALLSALLKLGLGIRLVVLTKEGITEL